MLLEIFGNRNKAKDILIRFESIREILNNIPNINRGGCGYSALAMYLWLKKEGYPYMRGISFTYLYQSTFYHYEINSGFIKGSEELPTSCSHVVLNFRGKEIDCTPNGEDFEIVKRHRKISEEVLRLSLKNGGWNSDFEAKKYLPKIEKKLGIKFW